MNTNKQDLTRQGDQNNDEGSLKKSEQLLDKTTTLPGDLTVGFHCLFSENAVQIPEPFNAVLVFFFLSSAVTSSGLFFLLSDAGDYDTRGRLLLVY